MKWLIMKFPMVVEVKINGKHQTGGTETLKKIEYHYKRNKDEEGTCSTMNTKELNSGKMKNDNNLNEEV